MASLIQRNGVFYVAWREGDRQRRKSLKTKSEIRARRAFELWKRNHAERDASPLDCEAAEFWKRYEPYIKRHMAPATVETKAIHWRRFLKEFQPEYLGDVTRGDVERLKATWHDAGMNPTSINNFLRAMKATYNAALTTTFSGNRPLYAGHNPFLGVRPVRQDTTEKRTLTAAEIQTLLGTAIRHSQTAYNRDTSQAGEIHLVFALGLYAGLRKNEIVAARWEWIDFEEKLIHMRQDATFTAKTGRDRTIPLDDRLAELLKPHKRPGGYIYRPDHIPAKRQRYRCNFQRSFRYVTKEAGIQRDAEGNVEKDTGAFDWVGVHTLRHTFATRKIRAGVDVAKVSKWLGHSSIRTTVDIYTHLGGYDDDINRG